jgi:hypothetical protein
MARSNIRHYFLGGLLSVVTIFAALWGWSSVGKMWFFDAEYPMWVAKIQMTQGCHGHQIAIIGDSPAMADLIPEYIGDSVINLAIGGASPIEVYYLTRRLLRCAQLPKKIILSISPFHLVAIDTYWPRSAAFHFLTLEETEAVRELSKTLEDGTIYGTSRTDMPMNMLKDYLYAVDFPYFFLASMKAGGFFLRKRANEEILTRTKARLGYHHFGVLGGTVALAPIAHMDEFRPPQLLNEYFQKTISLLNDKNVPVLFMSMPTNQATYEALSLEFHSGLLAYLRSFELRGNFRIVGDIIPVLPSTEFGDPSHLNPRAAIEWSKRVAPQISQ